MKQVDKKQEMQLVKEALTAILRENMSKDTLPTIVLPLIGVYKPRTDFLKGRVATVAHHFREGKINEAVYNYRMAKLCHIIKGSMRRKKPPMKDKMRIVGVLEFAERREIDLSRFGVEKPDYYEAVLKIIQKARQNAADKKARKRLCADGNCPPDGGLQGTE